MRRILPALAVCGVLGCSGGGRDCNEQGDFETTFGLELRGFSLGSTGKGYLSGLVTFGECDDDDGGASRIFAVDMTSRAVEAIDAPFNPGKVVASQDGLRAAATSFRYAAGVPDFNSGLLHLDGATPSVIPFGDMVWDIQPAAGGWVVSAGEAGSYEVSENGLSVTELSATQSHCGAALTDHRAICADTDVDLLSTSSGNVVVSLPFGEDVPYVVGALETAIVLHGTGVSVVRDGSVIDLESLGPDRGWDAWIAADARHAFVSGGGSGRWLDLVSGDSDNTSAANDAAFSNDYAILTLVDSIRTIVRVRRSDGVGEFVLAPPGSGSLDLVETLPDGRFAFASTYVSGEFRAGERIDVFITYDAATDTWDDAWGFKVE